MIFRRLLDAAGVPDPERIQFLIMRDMQRWVREIPTPGPDELVNRGTEAAVREHRLDIPEGAVLARRAFIDLASAHENVAPLLAEVRERARVLATQEVAKAFFYARDPEKEKYAWQAVHEDAVYRLMKLLIERPKE